MVASARAENELGLSTDWGSLDQLSIIDFWATRCLDQQARCRNISKNKGCQRSGNYLSAYFPIIKPTRQHGSFVTAGSEVWKYSETTYIFKAES